MESETSRKSPFEVLRSYLGQHFQCTSAEHKRVTFHVKLRAVTVLCQASISEDDRTLRFRILYPLEAPSGKRASTAVLASCANNFIRYGALHFDWDSREIFYQAVHFIGANGSLDDDTVFYVTWCGLSIADRFFPALMSHWHGDALPHEAALSADLDEPEDRLEDGVTHDHKNWCSNEQSNQ